MNEINIQFFLNIHKLKKKTRYKTAIKYKTG